MATHLDDEDDLEKLKTWWRENWLALAGGLVIGFGGIGGWEGYKNWRDGRAEAASAMYMQLQEHLQAGQAEQASALVDDLKRDYSDTPYAAVAALAAARAQVSRGELDQAASSLSWAAEHSDDPGVQLSARLREARVRFAQGQHDQALSLLAKAPAGRFESLYQELRGDIELARGNRDAARSAYEQALAKAAPDARNRAVLQQKRDDVAEASS